MEESNERPDCGASAANVAAHDAWNRACAALFAGVAALGGAGVSFAPLYLRIWGGMTLHPACPAVVRWSYRVMQTGDQSSEYGMCVTSPAWFAAVAMICMVTAVSMTVAGLRRAAAPRDGQGTDVPSAVWTSLAVVGLIAVAALGGNPVAVAAWMVHVALWWVYGRAFRLPFDGVVAVVASPGDSERVRPVLRRALPMARHVALGFLIGAMPVMLAELTVSDEVNLSGGATLACGLWLVAVGLLGAVRLAQSGHASRPFALERLLWAPVLIAGEIGVARSAYGYGAMPRSRGVRNLCPALTAVGDGTIRGVCVGARGLAALGDAVPVLLGVGVALLAVSLTAMIAGRAAPAIRRCATAGAMLSALPSTAAFAIGFTLA